mmetsp:Transcript_5530/g.21237  ORF Transcript_5530/g.21237 Transcript_5530/m.21237 type:complete len:218 (-) Transcript_5530:787-1440(-)
MAAVLSSTGGVFSLSTLPPLLFLFPFPLFASERDFRCSVVKVPASDGRLTGATTASAPPVLAIAASGKEEGRPAITLACAMKSLLDLFFLSAVAVGADDVSPAEVVVLSPPEFLCLLFPFCRLSFASSSTCRCLLSCTLPPAFLVRPSSPYPPLLERRLPLCLSAVALSLSLVLSLVLSLASLWPRSGAELFFSTVPPPTVGPDSTARSISITFASV